MKTEYKKVSELLALENEEVLKEFEMVELKGGKGVIISTGSKCGDVGGGCIKVGDRCSGAGDSCRPQTGHSCQGTGTNCIMGS